jgi:ATPase subunit of ABC transporter with duplicated ATPase domains
MASSVRVLGARVTLGVVTVLDGVDLADDPGQRVGIVGPNGVGKTTLLRAIAGQVPLERGTITFAPPTSTVGYLSQEPQRVAGENVRAYLGRRTGVTAAQAALDAATQALADGSPDAGDTYSAAFDRWMALGAADLDARVGEVWADLGLSARLLDEPMTVLSGGEAARASLAALLLSRYDVFLLDEPTNDLDHDGLARLEAFVTAQAAPIVLVSHDRTFLANTVTHVVEIDEFSRSASTFAGGWQAYVDEREAARRHAWEAFEEYDTKRKTLAGRAQREREWATQGLGRAKREAKQGIEKDKFIRAYKVNQTEQLAGRAARTDKAIERLEAVDKPREPWKLNLSIATAERGGDVAFRLEGAVVRRPSFTLGPIDLEIGGGERVALVGANGSGKTTLLNVLLGRQPLDEGERWQGPGVVVGELEQVRGQLRDSGSLLDAFMKATGMTVPDARTLLAKFGLVADHVTRPTGSLSPGERTRAVLGLLMVNGSNCLVLDEPTNHLDLPAIEQLEQALDTFPGTVLLVSHDRSMLERTRITRTIRLAAGHVVADDTV